MRDYSPEPAQTAAFAPEQMAQLLFSVKAIMEQQQVPADFPLQTLSFCRLLNVGHHDGSSVPEQAIIALRDNSTAL